MEVSSPHSTSILPPKGTPFLAKAKAKIFSSITTTATCGEEKPELFCKLSAGSDYGQEQLLSDHDSLLYGDFKGTGGQYCDVCDSKNPAKNHSIEFVKDGTERWWQSPPLSSNTHTRDLNKVNITIDMHQVIFRVCDLFVWVVAFIVFGPFRRPSIQKPRFIVLLKGDTIFVKRKIVLRVFF